MIISGASTRRLVSVLAICVAAACPVFGACLVTIQNETQKKRAEVRRNITRAPSNGNLVLLRFSQVVGLHQRSHLAYWASSRVLAAISTQDKRTVSSSFAWIAREIGLVVRRGTSSPSIRRMRVAPRSMKKLSPVWMVDELLLVRGRHRDLLNRST